MAPGPSRLNPTNGKGKRKGVPSNVKNIVKKLHLSGRGPREAERSILYKKVTGAMSGLRACKNTYVLKDYLRHTHDASFSNLTSEEAELLGEFGPFWEGPGWFIEVEDDRALVALIHDISTHCATQMLPPHQFLQLGDDFEVTRQHLEAAGLLRQDSGAPAPSGAGDMPAAADTS